ncbi:MAG: TIGR03013 family PEP-CTERM/XrtA system glycosyltransferase [Acidobacteria bacterium]|nr:TIGR03013 family PEP-CTERM/XrtA system glycosyltransferase [Acidobacteriota bacterium]
MIRVFNQYVSTKSLLLILLEAILIALSFVAGAKLRFWNDPVGFEAQTALPEFAFRCLIGAMLLQACFYLNHLYDAQVTANRGEQVMRLIESVGAACLLLGILYFLIPELLIGRGILLWAVCLVLLSTALARTLLDSAWKSSATRSNVLIFGTGEMAMTLGREISRRSDLNLHLAGFVSEEVQPPEEQILLGKPVLGQVRDLESLMERLDVTRIIVALRDQRGSLPIRDLVKLRVRGVRIEDAPSAISALTGRVWLDTVRPSWFVFSDGFQRSRLTHLWKRILDLACGLAGAIVTTPLMLLTALAIWLDDRGPVFYRQTRVGLRGKPFDLVKFRSMRLDAELNGAQWAQENDPRTTRVGGFLRRYRLDELPQFFNVIRGEMSFVGPRPERPVFVDQLSERIPYYEERHSVRPGITGWAQVQYPYGASVEDAIRKLEYDLFYLKSMSFPFDCAIVFQTIRTVLFGRGGR